MTTPVSGTDPTTQSPTTAAKAKPADDKDMFMKLLVAQLKYQNPMSPSDPNQFMAQTAQFTMVEKLEQLAAESTQQRAYTASLTATSLLGRTVTWAGSDGAEQSGVVTGSSFGTAGATLHIGDERVALDQIRSVTTNP